MKFIIYLKEPIFYFGLFDFRSTLFDKAISVSQQSMMSKMSKASLLPKPPKGYHNEDKFVSPAIRTQKTPIHTQDKPEMSPIDEGDEEEETMLELSPGGLDEIDSNFQMDDLANQTSTLDITQSFSAKKRKTYVGNTPASSKKGTNIKSNTPGPLMKCKTTSNTPGKIKKKSPLKFTVKKKSKIGSKQPKRFNI